MEGRYVNYFEIGHNAFEVILDFGQFYEGEAEPTQHTRIVTSPVYAKRLSGLLQQAIRQYEASYGRVVDLDEEEAAADPRGRALKVM